MRRRLARASHITGGAAATQTPAKKRGQSAPTQTSPRALQPTHTAKRAGPLPQEAGQPRRRFDDSNDTYTARGSTKVLSEKQRQDPEHGNSCGGERVVSRYNDSSYLARGAALRHSRGRGLWRAVRRARGDLPPHGSGIVYEEGYRTSRGIETDRRLFIRKKQIQVAYFGTIILRVGHGSLGYIWKPGNGRDPHDELVGRSWVFFSFSCGRLGAHVARARRQTFSRGRSRVFCR